MNLDEFKRVYSNQDILTEAIPYFWKNFDPEVYSIWYCEYTENLQGKLSFMVSNLVEGMWTALWAMHVDTFVYKLWIHLVVSLKLYSRDDY